MNNVLASIKKYQVYILLFFVAAFFIILAFVSESQFGGADNYSHYRIARYAFKYPRLFFDHWGKPVFTFLSSPFAQFGLVGVKIFNVVCAVLTMLLGYKIAKQLNYRHDLLYVLFIAFTPIYFIFICTALTEILFALILMLSVYLFMKERYVFSAIVLSFIILSRTEGLIFFPLWIFMLVIKRKYFPILFLGTGFLLFSIIGGIVLGDFIWIITNMPYGGSSVYGSGSFMHFIYKTDLINGIPLALLFVLGILSIAIEIIRSRKISDKNLLEIFLFAGIYGIYLFAHSYAWWSGNKSSAGLIRVMAAVMPFAALISFKGLLFITSFLKNKYLELAVIVVVLYLIITLPFKMYNLPIKYDHEEKYVKQASEWLKSLEYNPGKIYYYNTTFLHFMEIDPFDKSKSNERVFSRTQPSQDLESGSIIQWDSHFGRLEGQLPLETLKTDTNLRVIYQGGTNIEKGDPYYEIYLFERL